MYIIYSLSNIIEKRKDKIKCNCHTAITLSNVKSAIVIPILKDGAYKRDNISKFSLA